MERMGKCHYFIFVTDLCLSNIHAPLLEGGWGQDIDFKEVMTVALDNPGDDDTRHTCRGFVSGNSNQLS